MTDKNSNMAMQKIHFHAVLLKNAPKQFKEVLQAKKQRPTVQVCELCICILFSIKI